MNSVTAKYSRTKQSVTRALWQHDYGQKLLFEGFDLPETIEVHFSNKGDENTIVKFGDRRGVRIPDELLTSGKDIDAWVYTHKFRCDGESAYHVIIPVMKRGKVEETQDEEPVVEYIFDGKDSEYEDVSPCKVEEYIFDGRDSSDT